MQQTTSMDAAALDIELDEDGRVHGEFAQDLQFHCRVWEDVLKTTAAPASLEEEGSKKTNAQQKRSRPAEDGDEHRSAYLEAVTEACCRLDALSKREEEVDATFWIPASKMETINDEDASLLEALACRIFRIHTKGARFDPAISGVEWWVQLRDAPADIPDENSDAADDATAAMAPTPQKRRCLETPAQKDSNETPHGDARSSPRQHDCNKSSRSASTTSSGEVSASGQPVAAASSGSEDSEEDDGDQEVSSIPFHIDKDETLSALAAVYVTPALSTVTYLSAEGAPTVVTPLMYSNEKNAFEYSADAIPGNMAVCYPKAGRHLVFDGRLMHGVPSSFVRASSAAPRGNDNKPPALAGPKDGRRITFLANIWLNHQPVGIEALPVQVKRSIYDKESTLDASLQRLDLGPETEPTSCTEKLLSSTPSADALAEMNQTNGTATTAAAPASQDTQVFPLNEAPEDVAGIALPPPLSEGSFQVYTEARYRPKLVVRHRKASK